VRWIAGADLDDAVRRRDAQKARHARGAAARLVDHGDEKRIGRSRALRQPATKRRQIGEGSIAEIDPEVVMAGRQREEVVGMAPGIDRLKPDVASLESLLLRRRNRSPFQRRADRQRGLLHLALPVMSVTRRHYRRRRRRGVTSNRHGSRAPEAPSRGWQNRIDLLKNCGQ
jgi:hypothetical protein